jgi:ferrochelatase
VNKIGVMVMAYGTPSSREEVEPYYTLIRHGRPPTTEQLDDLNRRYDAIGGISPLNELTQAQVDGVTDGLERLAPGRFDVRFGSKYTSPSIEETAAALVADGVTQVIGLTLTPHSASMGSAEYMARAQAALGDGVSFHPIAFWYDAPGFLEILAAKVTVAIASLPEDLASDPLVLFTAHSLPMRILESGDPYPDQLADSAERIAKLAGLGRYEVAWQSAGRTPEPWIGPDILEVIAKLPERGERAVVICPVGFVADHLEVLFDVDIDAQRVAKDAGVTLVRTTSLNADPAFTDILAERIIAELS